jgi:hypothetical protein
MPVMKWIIALAVLAGLGYGGSKAYLHHKVGETVDNAVVMASPWVDIEYKGISSTMGGELTVNGVTAKVTGFRDEITIDRIGITTPSFLSLLSLSDLLSFSNAGAPEFPETVGFLVDGLHIDADSDLLRTGYEFRVEALGVADAEMPAAQCVGKYGFSPEALKALGYQEQVISTEVSFHNSASRFSMEVGAGSRDMFEWDMEVVMDGSLAAGIAQGAAYRPALRSMKFEFKDASLNKRIDEYCRALGLTQEEIVQARLDALVFFGEAMGIVFDELIIEPYQDFTAGKSTFVITAEPSKPLPLSQISLYNPKDVPALLNLNASAL